MHFDRDIFLDSNCTPFFFLPREYSRGVEVWVLTVFFLIRTSLKVSHFCILFFYIYGIFYNFGQVDVLWEYHKKGNVKPPRSSWWSYLSDNEGDFSDCPIFFGLWLYALSFYWERLICECFFFFVPMVLWEGILLLDFLFSILISQEFDHRDFVPLLQSTEVFFGGISFFITHLDCCLLCNSPPTSAYRLSVFYEFHKDHLHYLHTHTQPQNKEKQVISKLDLLIKGSQ